jgi:hypothetical protein
MHEVSGCHGAIHTHFWCHGTRGTPGEKIYRNVTLNG